MAGTGGGFGKDESNDTSERSVLAEGICRGCDVDFIANTEMGSLDCYDAVQYR